MNLIDVLTQPFQRRSQAFMSDDFERQYFPQMVDLRPTKTGKQYAVEDLLKNATVWRSCMVRMQSVAVLPRRLFKEQDDGGRQEVKKTDPRQKLMKRPNPELTKYDIDAYMQLQKLLYGTAFVQQIRDENFRVIQHWPLQSKQMSVARDKNNLLVWKYRLPKGGERIFAPWELHIRRGPTLDGVLGLSVFELAFDSLAVGIGLEEYCARVFENDSTPRGILSTKNMLDKEAKDSIREAWTATYGGLKNRGKIGILDGELDFKPIGMTNDVAQFLESRKFQREEIAAWFNVPQHMAGVLDRSTNNNIEQQSKEFIRDTLNPDLEAIEQELERDILWSVEQDSLFVEHRVESLLRGDFGDQTNYMVTELTNGVRTLNEVRKWKNLNPVPHGDENWKPLAIGTLGEDPPAAPAPGEQNEPPDDENPAEDQAENEPKSTKKPAKKQQKRAEIADFKPILLDTWTRIINKEIAAFDKEIKRAESVDQVKAWSKKWSETHGAFAEMLLKPTFETVRAVTGVYLRADQKKALADVVEAYVNKTEAAIRACEHLQDCVDTKEIWQEDNRALQLTEMTIQHLEDVSHE